MVGVMKSPAISASRQSRQLLIFSPYQSVGVGLAQGCFVSAFARANAATLIAAAGALPDTAEIAKMRLRILFASSAPPCCAPLSSRSPMTLAVKNPARLAPPEPTMMIGLGHKLGLPAQSFFCIQRSTARLSWIGDRSSCFLSTASALMRRTE